MQDLWGENWQNMLYHVFKKWTMLYLVNPHSLLQEIGYTAPLGSHPPTAEQIEARLRERYLDPGLGKDYELLRSALAQIGEATPVPNKTGPIVLYQLPAIVRKILYRGSDK